MNWSPDISPFRPRAPWVNGDLQTLRNFLLRPRIDLSRWPGEDFTIAAPDGSGDRFLGVWHARCDAAPAQRGPDYVVLLVHGLTGCADSSYMQRTAATVLAAGHSVLRMNWRGAGPSRRTCRGHYYAGVSDDLATFIAAARERLVDRAQRLMVVGYSLGANVLLKYLGETGDVSGIDRAIAVSPPIDLHRTSAFFRRRRNWLYQHWLLSNMKLEALAPIAAVSERQRATIKAAKSIWEFDDTFVGPKFGFAGAADYYARCSSAPLLADIKVPTTVVHSDDDPWIPVDMFTAVDWSSLSNVSLKLTRGGGHVGFHDRADRLPWHDRYIRAALEIGNES